MRERLITIDIDEGNFRVLRYKQFDNNNILKVSITEKKKIVDLSMYTARFFFKLPSDNILQKDTVIENNEIKVILDSGIFSESGRVLVEITLSNEEQIVTTFTMYFEVEETIDRNEAIQSMPEWDIISSILGIDGTNTLDNKVDKEEGKGLISLSEIERLANVDNYDDTEIREIIEEKADKDELHEHENKNILDNITDDKINEWDNKSDFNGDYNSLINKPTIPSIEGLATETYVQNKIAEAELSREEVDLSGLATKDELNVKADKSEIPTKVSDLINDANYLTSVPSEYITETELNDKGYLTEHIDISGKVDKEDGKSLIADSEIERLKNVEDNANNYIHPNNHNATMIIEDENHRFVTDVEKENWNNKEEKNHTHKELHEHANKDILDDITSDKIDEWDNKSEFDGDYNSLSNKPTIPTRVSQLTNDGIYATETYVQNKIAEAQLSGEEVDLTGFATKDELKAKADVEDIPTKVSQLENDSNYLTSVPSEYITETELEDKGYLTEHQDISGKVDKETGKSLIDNNEIERLKNIEDNANNYIHPSTHSATMITEDENHRFVTDDEKAFWDNKSEFDGNYNSLSNKPTIPSIEGLATETYVQNKIAEAELSGEEVDLTGFATKDELKAKADVEDIPTKVSQLENDSNYLTSVPSEYVTETELEDKGYLTEHQDISYKADKSEIPTKTSELENDSEFVNQNDFDISITNVNETIKESADDLNDRIGLKNNNSISVAEIIGVAKSYYNVRTKEDGTPLFIYDTGHTPLSDNYNPNNETYAGAIDCSTYIGLVLRGIPFLKSPYSHLVARVEDDPNSNLTEDDVTGDEIGDDGVDSEVWNPSLITENKKDYPWAINPFNWKLPTTQSSSPTSIRRASQLAQWMFERGMSIPLDETFSNLEPGDIIFWAKTDSDGNYTQPNRYKHISHVALCIGKYDAPTDDAQFPIEYPFKHTMLEVTTISPYVLNRTLEKVRPNEVVMICRPDLGSLLTENFAGNIKTQWGITDISELYRPGIYYLTSSVTEGLPDNLSNGIYLTLKVERTITKLGKPYSLIQTLINVKTNDTVYRRTQYCYSHLPNKTSWTPWKALDMTKEGIESILTGDISTHTHSQYLTEHQDLSDYALKTEIPTVPTKTSQLTNDSGYLTSVPSEYITETELNEKGYLTEHIDISGKVDKEDGKSLIADSEIERLANIDNYTHPSTHNATIIVEDANHRFVSDTEKELWNSKSEFDGNYNSLTNKPTIPSIEGLATETYVENEINKKINVDLISNSISGTVLTLTNDRYQVAEIVDGTTIVLPVVETYTEIHLFFTTTNDITIIMPNGIKYQKIPTIIADKTYEFIFTYTNADMNWVFGYIEYTN